MTDYELRVRATKRLPPSLRPELRIWIGRAETKRGKSVMAHRREVLRQLERRGQWDVLQGVRDGRYTVEEVVRVADTSGLDTLHLTLSDPGQGEPLSEVVPRFLASIERETTRESYRIDLRKLVDAVGAPTPWTAVGRHQVEDVLDAMRKRGYAANTRAAARTAWSALYTWLLRREESVAEQGGRRARATTHPVRGAKRVVTATTRHRWLQPEELARIVDAAPKPLRPQYLALVYTGMRIGEFVSRLPEEVDLEGFRVLVQPREDWAPKGYPRYVHGVREIPMHRARLLPALVEYREKWAGARSFFANPRSADPWTPITFRRQLAEDVRAAGLIYGRDHPDGITPHTFRHTLGSWLAREDVQLKKIAAILGDTTVTVERYYAHLLPSDIDETLNEALK